MKYPFLFIFAMVFCHSAFSQVVVDDARTAEELVNQILLGIGITAENVTINGLPSSTISKQFGYFEATESNLGIDRGIILATGGISVAESPNDLPSAQMSIPESDDLTVEPDLDVMVSPASLRNVAVLEFDFTAKGDTLRMKYIFASEEYNEHTCSVYNDVFGFFISGPGITGTFANGGKNIALIPNSNTPVAINTLNQGFAGNFGSNSICNSTSPNWQLNSSYFVNNENNTNPNAPQFDGFTVPMMIEYPVECGAQYHIKIAIADAVDEHNDSAVFFEAGSFSSNAPLTVEYEILNPGAVGEALEGCSSIQIKLNRADSIGAKTVFVRAENLENSEAILANLPSSLTFYNLQSELLLTIPIENDGIFAGMRESEILFLQSEVCSQDTFAISIPITIADRPNMVVSTTPQLTLNCIQEAEIEINVEGGYPPYEITWADPSYTGFNFTLDPENSLTLQALIKDACNSNEENVEIEIIRETYESLAFVLPDTIGINCADSVELFAVVTGGEGTYTYEWTVNGELLSTSPIFEHLFTEEGNVNLNISDLCVSSLSVNSWAASVTPPLVLDLGSDRVGSCGESLLFLPSLFGGSGNLTYVWRLNQNAASGESIFNFIPNESSLVSLEVYDECGQSAYDELFVTIDQAPLSIGLPSEITICKGERLELSANVSGGGGSYQYTWNGQPSDDGELSVFPGRNQLFTLIVSDACGSVMTHQVQVLISEVEAYFEFDLENVNQPLLNLSTEGADSFWSFPDGSSSHDRLPIVSNSSLLDGYTVLRVENEYGCWDEASLEYEPIFRVFIPTAFSPDGDGLNEIFKAEGQFVASFFIQIFDRWGRKVFESESMQNGWNGDSPFNEDYNGEPNLYSYRYQATSVNGEINEGIGQLMVMR